MTSLYQTGHVYAMIVEKYSAAIVREYENEDDERVVAMIGKNTWSRRDFVQLFGTAALGSRALSSTLASPNSSASSSTYGADFMYVGCGDKANTIEVFAASGDRWKHLQQLESESPVSLSLASNARTLYVVNQVDRFRGLPRGTVAAYTIANDGRLTLLNRRELSLSATSPRHASLSPDGRSLVVTAHGGGIYNTIPLAKDGWLEAASSIFKVTGDADGRQAQPKMAIFDRAGRIVSIDQGTRSLRVLTTTEDGLSNHAVSMMDDHKTPNHLAMHHELNVLYIAHEDSLDCYGYDHQAGQVLGRRQRIPNTGVVDSVNALAIHPSGRLVLTCSKAGGVAAWKLSPNGDLSSAGSHGEEMGCLDAIQISRDGKGILTINKERGEVSSAAVNISDGRVSEWRTLAHVHRPLSLAVIYS
jgi:6-phosphogluconolactonase (cycloisomerase 2 family)